MGIILPGVLAGNSAPRISRTASSFPEDTASGTTIATLSVNHPSGSSGWTFAKSNDTDNKFSATITAGALKTAASVDFEADTDHPVRITASKSGQADIVADFVFSVTNVLEVTLSAITGTFVLAENAAAAAIAGAYSGKSSGSTLTLLDDAGGRVAISGGNIVRGATALDYESATSHSFTTHETHPDGNNSPRDTVLSLTVTDIDESAPTLSSPTDAANGATGATISVSTNEGNGTLYWFISTSATPPSASALQAGTGAVVAGNQGVSGTGVQNASPTGLTASTQYYTYFLHRDAAGNDSTIAAADGFTTAAASLTNTAAPDIAGDSNETGVAWLSGGDWSATPNKYQYDFQKNGTSLSGYPVTTTEDAVQIIWPTAAVAATAADVITARVRASTDNGATYSAWVDATNSLEPFSNYITPAAITGTPVLTRTSASGVLPMTLTLSGVTLFPSYNLQWERTDAVGNIIQVYTQALSNTYLSNTFQMDTSGNDDPSPAPEAFITNPTDKWRVRVTSGLFVDALYSIAYGYASKWSNIATPTDVVGGRRYVKFNVTAIQEYNFRLVLKELAISTSSGGPNIAREKTILFPSATDINTTDLWFDERDTKGMIGYNFASYPVVVDLGALYDLSSGEFKIQEHDGDLSAPIAFTVSLSADNVTYDPPVVSETAADWSGAGNTIRTYTWNASIFPFTTSATGTAGEELRAQANWTTAGNATAAAVPKRNGSGKWVTTSYPNGTGIPDGYAVVDTASVNHTISAPMYGNDIYGGLIFGFVDINNYLVVGLNANDAIYVHQVIGGVRTAFITSWDSAGTCPDGATISAHKKSSGTLLDVSVNGTVRIANFAVPSAVQAGTKVGMGTSYNDFRPSTGSITVNNT